MLKNKAVIVTITMLFSIFTAALITTGMKEESIPKITIDTNKLNYEVGENVKIIYTNPGNAVAGFVVGTARPVIPCIIEFKTGKKLLLTDPSHCYPCVMMYGVLEPGDSLTLEWDQQYYGYYGDSFTPSEQVPEGLYFIELGYWEVIGEYILPYMVPGGPPDHFERSKIFNIGKGRSESDSPTVSISYPEERETVSDVVNITGEAHDPNSNAQLEWVFLSIDSDVWLEADLDIVTGNWSYVWDSTTVEDGEHIVSAITYDGSLQSAVANIVFSVQNEEEPEPVKYPDLECSGTLSWTDVEPGETLTDSFTLSNVGDSESLLDWEVDEVPDWGTWTCNPNDGYNLKPEDGIVTVQVSVVAPDDEEEDFSGHVITVINMDDTSDYESIEVSLSTPKIKAVKTPFLTFPENQSHLFPLLRQILGL